MLQIHIVCKTAGEPRAGEEIPPLHKQGHGDIDVLGIYYCTLLSRVKGKERKEIEFFFKSMTHNGSSKRLRGCSVIPKMIYCELKDHML